MKFPQQSGQAVKHPAGRLTSHEGAGYAAYGRQRDSGPVVTDHRFTGQKVDGNGLYYYNARYYDPVLGAFISPDTLVPDPTNLLDYNRYMYVRGRPLTMNDPSGHCGTLADGSRDTDGDGDCWQKVDTIVNGYWQGDNEWWNDRFVSSAHFVETLAPLETLDANWMDVQIHEYLTRNGSAHYTNSQPQMHPVTAQEQAFEQFHAKHVPENVMLDPAALSVATLKAGMVIGPMWKQGGMAACATGVACPAGAAFVTAGQVYGDSWLYDTSRQGYVYPHME